jgi:hypothetical protein
VELAVKCPGMFAVVKEQAQLTGELHMSAGPVAKWRFPSEIGTSVELAIIGGWTVTIFCCLRYYLD